MLPIEFGWRAFPGKGGFQAFTTTFEDLYGLANCLVWQFSRLMAEGYGSARR